MAIAQEAIGDRGKTLMAIAREAIGDRGKMVMAIAREATGNQGKTEMGIAREATGDQEIQEVLISDKVEIAHKVTGDQEGKMEVSKDQGEKQGIIILDKKGTTLKEIGRTRTKHLSISRKIKEKKPMKRITWNNLLKKRCMTMMKVD